MYHVYALHSAVLEIAVRWSEVKSLSRVQLFATPWTVASQDSQSMVFSRQEYWSGVAMSFSKKLLLHSFKLIYRVRFQFHSVQFYGPWQVDLILKW